MRRKIMLIALAAVSVGIAGAVSSAQAASDQSEWRGGYKIGPFGQRFGGPRARGIFAFAPLPGRHFRLHRRHYYYY